ncbi:MAG: ABC transporter ATP-binding protein [Acidimicrobiales bacterium]
MTSQVGSDGPAVTGSDGPATGAEQATGRTAPWSAGGTVARARPDGLAVQTTGLTKAFGKRNVVDGIDLAVPEGSVFGFLGPNGSGKTTTIRMLLGLAFPTAGQVRLLGHEMPALSALALPLVGAVVEGPGFYPFLSGWDNLVRMDAVQRPLRTSEGGAPAPGAEPPSPGNRGARVGEALRRVGLYSSKDKRYRTYSLGMRQRLSIAAALLRPTRLLILDEPTNGLDPQGMREVRSLVRALATGGMTVFLSSHLLAEVEQICTHAAVMAAGRVVAQGPIDALREAQQAVLRVETPDTEVAVSVLGSMVGIGLTTAATTTTGAGTVRAELRGAEPEDCTAALVRAGVRVRSLTTDAPSLEDTFVALTGEGFDVA